MVKFGNIVRDVKINVDRSNNPYKHYVAGDHMDSEDLTIHRHGDFATDDVGPAFTRIFKPGQILYGSRRTYLKKIAVADFSGICANTTFVLESKDETVFLTRLLPFIMLSESFTRWSIAHSKGSTNPYVLFSDLADYELDLPPIYEQRILADKLWAAYRLKESYKKLLTATQEMVKSQFIEMFGDPMTNSKGWSEHGKINKYAQIILGSTPNSKEASYWDGDIKWITPAEMTEESYYIYDTERHITEEGVNSASLTLLPYRSVLFSTRAPIGKIGLVGSPMYCNQGFKNFICGNQLNPVYLYYSLIYKREYLVSLGTGTTFKELSKKTVEGLELAIPPIYLQEQFEKIYDHADKSEFVGFKSQFIEMFAFQDLSLTNPSDDFAQKCYDDTSSATKVPAGDYQNNGRYAIYDQSQDCNIAGYTDSNEGVCNNYPAVLFGDHSRVIKYINRPFYIGADGVKIIRPKGDYILPEFLYYDLLYHDIPNTGYNRHFKYVKMLKLTEASIDEQEEFLKIAHQADKSEYYN